MKTRFALALLTALALSATVARADDAETKLANERPGVTFVLRAEAGQTRFRQGETIHLYARFSSDRPGYKLKRFVQNNRGMATLGTVQVAPTEGVANPLGEVPPPSFMSIMGNVPDPVALGEKPVEIPFVLNEWARFDRPGIYQVTLTTGRVFASTSNQKRGAILLPNPSSSITSEPLQIEIVPADAAWQSEQIQQWREYWRKYPNAPSYGQKPPRNDISFIGTRAAMSAIIEHLGQNKAPRSSDDDSYLFRTGLIGFAERDWLIREMKRAIERPDYAVTQGFFGLLSELQSLENTPRPAGADATRVGSKKDAQGQYEKDEKGRYISATPTPAQQLQIDWERRLSDARNAARSRDWLQTADAIERKTDPKARAMTLHSLLELAWHSDLNKEPNVQARVPKLVAQLAPVFDQLPPLPRAYLLGDEWDRVRSPALVPALQRARQLPVGKNDYRARDAADLTLKRLAELAPQIGRAQIIEQIKRPKPSLGFEALRVLPDATLPALDEVLATNFLNAQGENLELSAQLLWRYATSAVLPRIKADYEKSSDRYDNASLVATLAYLVRVNPGYGVPKVAQWARRSGKQAFYSSLLFDVALLQPGPQLEALAIANLTNQGEGTANDAAQTLARIGSPAAQSALMARLRNPAPVAHPKSRARLESRLVVALATAQSWLCPPDQLRQIRALCQTDEGRRTADDYLRERTDGEPLVVDYSSGTREFWSVERYSGRSLADLRAKLAQFPRGSEFFWQMTSSRGPDADEAFESTRKWASERGLKIRPYDEIDARRKELGLY